MKLLPINNNIGLNRNFTGYRNLSEKIINSDSKGLIELAEYFHKAEEKELNQITGANPSALSKLKEAISKVIVRKKCYIADGSSFCKQRAIDLDKKAAERFTYLQG